MLITGDRAVAPLGCCKGQASGEGPDLADANVGVAEGIAEVATEWPFGWLHRRRREDQVPEAKGVFLDGGHAVLLVLAASTGE